MSFFLFELSSTIIYSIDELSSMLLLNRVRAALRRPRQKQAGFSEHVISAKYLSVLAWSPALAYSLINL